MKTKLVSFEDAIIMAFIIMNEKGHTMESGIMDIPMGKFSFKIRKLKK